jgi:two-component system response regulator FlrC
MTFRPEAYRILVVDDDSGMRLAMYETLRRKRYQVDQASNGEEGLEMAGKYAYQALITDLRMPGMTGLELLHKVKAKSPATEVILVTAYGTVSTAVDAMKEGAYDYLQKPFSTSDLEKIVYNALTKEIPENAVKPAKAGKYEIVTRSEKMLRMLEMAKRAAKSDATVLIQAESGTGKELLARYICAHSNRAKKPVVAINCAALPDNLLESELFGYEKGSFTGAINSKPGKFEMADGGTILLDEIGEMPLGLQSKLLRVLQEQEVDRIGGKQPIPIDVRVIAMTNSELKKSINDGSFREDLFYRLNVIPFEIPPLNERREDIEALCAHFIQKYAPGEGVTLSARAAKILERFDWNGNVRELENVIQRALILRQKDELEVSDLFQLQDSPESGSSVSLGDGEDHRVIAVRPGTSVQEMERKLIEVTLEETNVNKTHAAKMLGISLRTLRNKLNEYQAADIAR